MRSLPESAKIHGQKKSFLNSNLDVFKVLQLITRHINTKIINYKYNLEVFAAKVYNKKIPKGKSYAEPRWDIYLEDLKKKDIKNESANVKNRKQKSLFEKMAPTYGVFHQHVKRALLQSLIFNQADNAIIEMKNLELFGWKFDGTRL